MLGLAKSQATRKAQRFYSERRIPVAYHDLKKRELSQGELRRWSDVLGVGALVDSESKAFRDAGLQYLGGSDDDWLRRLADDVRLLNLPLVRYGTAVAAGEDPDGWQRIADAASDADGAP